MTWVRAVREHQNLYGDRPSKQTGDEYELPENLVPGLAAAGLVALVDDAEAVEQPKPKAKGRKG